MEDEMTATPPMGIHEEWEALQIFGKHLIIAYEEGGEPLTTEDLLHLYAEEAQQTFFRTFPRYKKLETFLNKHEGFYYYPEMEVWMCDPDQVVDTLDQYYSMIADDYGDDWEKPWLTMKE